MYNLRHSTATLVWYLIIYVMLVSCGQKPAKISLAERKAYGQYRLFYARY